MRLFQTRPQSRVDSHGRANDFIGEVAMRHFRIEWHHLLPGLSASKLSKAASSVSADNYQMRIDSNHPLIRYGEANPLTGRRDISVVATSNFQIRK